MTRFLPNNRMVFWIFLLALILALLFPQIGHALGYLQEEPPPLTVPDMLASVLLIYLAYLVNLGVQYILAHFGIDFTGFAATLTQALFTALLLFLNGVLGEVPPLFHGIVREVLLLLAFLIGGLGIKMREVADRAARLGMISAFQLMKQRKPGKA